MANNDSLNLDDMTAEELEGLLFCFDDGEDMADIETHEDMGTLNLVG